MKWSVALFGHYKPEYYIVKNEPWDQTIPMGAGRKPKIIRHGTRVVAMVMADEFVVYTDRIRSGDFTFSRRNHFLQDVSKDLKLPVRVGDVVAFRPFEDRWKWTPYERKAFMIVAVDDLSREQMEAMCEPEKDLNSYPNYSELFVSKEVFRERKRLLSLKKPDPARWMAEKVDSRLDELYAAFIDETKDFCGEPRKPWANRRFTFGLDDLDRQGVQTDIMLNQGVEYWLPDKVMDLTVMHDRLKKKYVDSSYKFNRIRPRTEVEMIQNVSGDTILSEIRR